MSRFRIYDAMIIGRSGDSQHQADLSESGKFRSPLWISGVRWIAVFSFFSTIAFMVLSLFGGTGSSESAFDPNRSTAV